MNVYAVKNKNRQTDASLALKALNKTLRTPSGRERNKNQTRINRILTPKLIYIR